MFKKKNEVQAFGDILDGTVESIPVNGENVEVTQMFTYLDRVIDGNYFVFSFKKSTYSESFLHSIG